MRLQDYFLNTDMMKNGIKTALFAYSILAFSQNESSLEKDCLLLGTTLESFC